MNRQDGAGLRLEMDDDVGVVRLNHPPVNAIGGAMLERLAEVFASPDVALPGARAIALVADGPHFSAGHDRAESDRRGDAAYLETAASHLQTILQCPLPVVAGVHGAAVGTGFILACCADVMVVAPDARVSLPEVSLGLLGGAGHARRWLPPAMVRHLVLGGQTLDGAALGGVGMVMPDAGESAASRAIRAAAELATWPASAVTSAREILNDFGPDAAIVHAAEMRTSGNSR